MSTQMKLKQTFVLSAFIFKHIVGTILISSCIHLMCPLNYSLSTKFNFITSYEIKLPVTAQKCIRYTKCNQIKITLILLLGLNISTI